MSVVKSVINSIKTRLSFVFASRVRTIIFLLILTGLGYLGYRFFLAPVGQVKTYTVTKSKFTQTVSATGKIVAARSATLKFITPGKVVWVGVKKGDQVRQWQGIASQDSRQVEKNLRLKLLDYMTTRWDFEQAQDDYQVGGQTLDKVVNLTDAEKRILEKSQFGLDQSVLNVEIANLAVKESVLVTPVAGTVVSTGDLVAGENLTASDIATKYIKIIDFTSLYVEAEVDEVDFYLIEVGQPATISLDAFPDKTLTGKVKFVGKEGIKTTGGATNIIVDISLDQASSDLLPGLNGEAEFAVSQKENILIVPREFISLQDGKNTVLLQKDGKVKNQEVTLGLTSSTQVEILSGLSEGDTLLFKPQ